MPLRKLYLLKGIGSGDLLRHMPLGLRVDKVNVRELIGSQPVLESSSRGPVIACADPISGNEFSYTFRPSFQC